MSVDVLFSVGPVADRAVGSDSTSNMATCASAASPQEHVRQTIEHFCDSET